MVVRPRSIRNVLVVDDDEGLLASWARTIGRERTVRTASEAAIARKLAEEYGFDLAIVDMRLRAGSGLELIKHLRRSHGSSSIVLCSGYLSVEAAVAGVRAGADLVVFKPVTFKEILRRLEEPDEPPELDDTPTLARAEWEHIMRVLADCNGNISMAARRLGIYRSSLQRRLRKFAPQK